MAGRRRRPAAIAPALLLVAIAGACERVETPAIPASELIPGERVWLDLAGDFADAEIFQEAGFVDFGRPTAAAHLRAGFGEDESENGVDFVWGLGERSRIGFFLSAVRPLPLRFRAAPGPFGSAPQVVSVHANGVLQGAIELEDGTDEYALVLAADALRPGVNELELRYAWAVSAAEAIPNHVDTRRLAVKWVWLRLGDGEGPRAAAITDPPAEIRLPVGARADFHFEAPPGAELVVAGHRSEPRGAALRIRVRRQGEPGERSFQSFEGSLRLPLDLDAKTLVRLGIEAVAPADDSGGTLRVFAPQIRAPSPADPGGAAEASAAAHPSPARPAAPSTIVLYVSDTLRADHLGRWGDRRGLTPNLDALADAGLVFESAVAHASYTRPTTASIMTGLDPSGHRVIERGAGLRTEVATLAEILRAAGYRTGAFVGNPNAGPAFGFDQGYDHFASLYEPPGDGPTWSTLYRSRDSRARVGLSAPHNEFVYRWLEQEGNDRPVFLYVHSVAPHSPYEPPAPYRERFAPGLDDRPEIGAAPWVAALGQGRIPVTDEVLQQATSLYAAEVAYEDASFGGVIEYLKHLDRYDEALVVFVADHGEELHDHGAWEHGRTLYPEVVDVPLIVKLPASWGRGGETLDRLVSQADILPTVLGVAGLPTPSGLHGSDLLGPDVGRPVFSFLKLGELQAASVLTRKWRLVETFRPDATIELFDRNADPTAARDLSAAHAVTVGWLRQQLRRRMREAELRPPPTEAEVNVELERHLRELGYVW